MLKPLKGVEPLGFELPGGQVIHLPPELTRRERIDRYRKLLELYPQRLGGTDGVEDTP